MNVESSQLALGNEQSKNSAIVLSESQTRSHEKERRALRVLARIAAHFQVQPSESENEAFYRFLLGRRHLPTPEILQCATARSM